MLSTAQVNQWHDRGWTTIQIDVDEAADAAKELLPDSEEDTEFGSPNRIGEFPTGISALDDMVARPEIVNSVKQLLHAFDIRLLQADVWENTKVLINVYIKTMVTIRCYSQMGVTRSGSCYSVL